MVINKSPTGLYVMLMYLCFSFFFFFPWTNDLLVRLILDSLPLNAEIVIWLESFAWQGFRPALWGKTESATKDHQPLTSYSRNSEQCMTASSGG